MILINGYCILIVHYSGNNESEFYSALSNSIANCILCCYEEEIIHKLKIIQNGLSLDITDVGFGVSQVLPVIVQGFFAKSGSLTLIEQPEVHLHPRMQADLGDLFIDIALPYKDKVLCASHIFGEAPID